MATALVTGATSGIGAAFCRQLAAQGYRLVIVARDAQRLAEQRASLMTAGSPEVEVLAADLTDPHDVRLVAERLADEERPIDLLVNNAGKGLAKDFLDSTPDELTELLDLNVTSVLLLTRAALPAMVARGHGGIINVASIAGIVPGRGGTYGASKSWVIAFSEAMAMQYGPRGVRIQALNPGFVRTEFHDRAGIDMTSTPDWMYVDSEKLVRESLEALRHNKMTATPGALYQTITMANKLLPRSMIRSVAKKVSWKSSND